MKYMVQFAAAECLVLGQHRWRLCSGEHAVVMHLRSAHQLVSQSFIPTSDLSADLRKSVPKHGSTALKLLDKRQISDARIGLRFSGEGAVMNNTHRERFGFEQFLREK